MPIYVAQARGADQFALGRARFVRDGFSWPAFLITPIWLLFRRLWLAFVLWSLAEAAFFVLIFPHLGLGPALVIGLLAHLAMGFEGQGLRLAKNARRAAVTDVIAARDRDEAEALFFHHHVDQPVAERAT